MRSKQLNLKKLWQKRRWALLLINATAAVFVAPLLYWDCLVMRVFLGAVYDAQTLLGLNFLGSLGSVLWCLPAAVGIGACLSALRGILCTQTAQAPTPSQKKQEDQEQAAQEQDLHVTTLLARGFRMCVRSSLLLGLCFGGSLAVLQVGLVNLFTLWSANWLCVIAAAFLIAQAVLVVPVVLLAATQEDHAQRSPCQNLYEAARTFARNPLRTLSLTALTMIPLLLLFFLWQTPALTMLCVILVPFCGLTPVLLLWQWEGGVKVKLSQPQCPRVRKGLMSAVVFVLVFSFGALFLPAATSSANPIFSVLTSLRAGMGFLWRQTLLQADNSTVRDLFASGGIWVLFLVAIAGFCCVLAVGYYAALGHFRKRKLLYSAVVLLQIIPMLESLFSLRQFLLRFLRSAPLLGLGVIWIVLYLTVCFFLYRGFRRQRAAIPEPRLRGGFWTKALPRVPFCATALFLLLSLGCWNDLLAPFWHMLNLSSFSLSSYIWSRLPGGGQGTILISCFVALAICLFCVWEVSREKQETKNASNTGQQDLPPS